MGYALHRVHTPGRVPPSLLDLNVRDLRDHQAVSLLGLLLGAEFAKECTEILLFFLRHNLTLAGDLLT